MKHETQNLFSTKMRCLKRALDLLSFFSYAFFFIFQNKKMLLCSLSLEKTAPTHHQIVYFHFVCSRFIDKCLNYEQIRQICTIISTDDIHHHHLKIIRYVANCCIWKIFFDFFFIGNVNKWRKKYIWTNEEKVLLGILNREKKYVWRTFKVIYSMRKLTDIDILVKCTASFPIKKKSLQNNFEHRTITRIIHNQS